MEEGRGKGERGNGRDGTGHGMGRGKGKEEGGKGEEGIQPPNFNSWRRHWVHYYYYTMVLRVN